MSATLLFRDDAYLKDCAATVTAVNDKGGVKSTDLSYFSARHVLIHSIPGHSLYGQSDEPATVAQRPAGANIALTTAAMSEIAVLIPKGAPVTME